MLWFKKKSLETSKVDALHKAVSESFRNVKRDTQTLYQWLDYLHKRHLTQEQLIQQLRQELQYLPKTREDLRRVLDEYYSHDHLIKKIREIDERVEALYRRQTGIVPAHSQISPIGTERLEDIHQRLKLLEQKKSYFKEKIVKKITKSSKDYVKSIIISYIKKYEKISALQLKEMIVDEQMLCSKSSFYRLLEEIEKEHDIAVIKEGKEKHYLVKAVKKI